MRLSHKEVDDGFQFWCQPTIFLRKSFFVYVVRQVIVKNIKFETVMVFNLSEKDPNTIRALKN